MKCRTFLSVIAVVALHGAAQAAVILPNLPAGSQYRVAFVSTNSYQSYNTTTPAQTRSLSYWQNIVDAEAAASTDSTITGASFKLVGSIFDGSTTHNATTLTGMSSTVSDNIPVYSTLGQLVATDSVSFWSATHQAGMNGDRNGGTVASNVIAWTGWVPTLQTFRPFGHGNSTYYGSATNTAWNPGPTLGGTNFLRVFAISAPISVVPTPGSVALIALGGLVAARRRRA